MPNLHLKAYIYNILTLLKNNLINTCYINMYLPFLVWLIQIN
ncbi:hypothetical protein GILI108418_12975 [Gillisia limnaea]|uniref:Uncharacterized protein n=1 Tax=Gillisia limnaea (strain DSM 15749 / LMG 21470 / R-8282) TaxID=865937 RepID=H2BYU1_GILLR|nr:hypothetical protein Gilli_1596 [Gillisia limnaea DSM 15749]